MDAPAPRSGILAAGNWLVDHVKVIDQYPPQDSLATVLSQSLGNGGGPFNLLVDLRRLGAPFPLQALGLVGDDANGRWIRQRCAEQAIDTRQLRTTTEAATSYTDVMSVAGTGRRTFFHQRGANARLGESDFDFTGCTARWFYLGYLLLLDRLDALDPEGQTGAARVLASARAAGCRTAADCVSVPLESAPRIVASALPHLDLLLLNEFEAERSTGLKLSGEHGVDVEQAVAAARLLLGRGVRELVAIHFPAGAVAASRQGWQFRQGSVRVPPEKNRGATGAGDAFAAGLLHGLHEGWAVDRCLELGVCAAAACLSDPTASDGVRTVAECLELGRTYGFRPIA